MKLRVFPRMGVPGFLHPHARAHKALPLVDAFTREYPTDACVVQYVAGEADDELRAHRLTLASLQHAVARPVMALQLVDVDCAAAHRDGGEASAAWRTDQAERVARLRADCPGLVAYDTRKGYRLVALLREPMVLADTSAVARWRALVARRLAWLARDYGIVGDAACVDWTRFYRLPHGTRPLDEHTPGTTPERRAVQGRWTDLGAWPDLTDDTLDADRATLHERGWESLAKHLPGALLTQPRRAARGRTRPAPTPRTPLGDLRTDPRIASLVEALRALPRGGRGGAGLAARSSRHAALVALGGALVGDGWPDVLAERLCEDVERALGDADGELVDALRSARARVEAGEAVAGRGYLREHAPAVDEALPVPDESPGERWRRLLDRVKPPREVTVTEAQRRVRELLARVRADRSIAVAAVTTGAGKTHAACEAAREGAAAGSRTALVVPTHEVARECLARLRAWGVRVAYLAGVLAVRDERGEQVCAHAARAEQLADAGVGTLDTMCDGRGYAYRRPQGEGRRRLPTIADEHGHDAPCALRDGCQAYAERARQLAELEGADVLVTVHALADVAHRWLSARPAGALAVVDEGAELFAAAQVTVDELRRAADQVTAKRSVVTRSEVARLGPMLDALVAGLPAAPDGATITDTLLAGLRVSQSAELPVDTDEQRRARIAAWARRAGRTRSGEMRRQHAPRPARRLLDAARSRGDLPAVAVEALRVAGLVARGLAAEHDHAPRALVAVGTREHGADLGARELRVTALAAPLEELLSDKSIGRVSLDATADARALAAVLGLRDVPVERIAVRDARPVERLFVPWAHGNRRACLRDGEPAWAELLTGLLAGLRHATRGLQRGARVLAVTWLPVVRAIAAGRADPAVAAVLADLDAAGVAVEWVHYGAVRGVDRWREVDAVLAVGTPWPSVGAIAQVCAAAGAEQKRAELNTPTLAGAERDVGVQRARAELEQVCGRGRAPTRTSALRVVVVASLPPLRADARWQVEELVRGAPSVAVEGAPDLTAAAAAAAQGVSVSTVRRARRRAREALRAPTDEAEGGVSDCVVEVSATDCDTPPFRAAGPPPGVPLGAERAPRGRAACPAPGRVPDTVRPRRPPDTPVDGLCDSVLRCWA